MGFASGSVSFSRFAVIGEGPKTVDESLLEKIAAQALRPGELGVPEEIEYGWSGGRHVLDGQFHFEHNVFADAVSFAMRTDTNRVPGSLKTAWRLMEEEAAAASNPSGLISKNQKRQVKDSIGRKIDDELRTGRFRRSRLTPVLWDTPGGIVFAPATGATWERLAELFERTFGLSLLPLSAGRLGLRLLEASGRRRDYEDFRPTRFVQGPGGESEYPDYPWTAKCSEAKDFLGNEFLLWLWHEADCRNGPIAADSGGGVTVCIDRMLDVECAYGRTGRDILRGEIPSRTPEARDALRSGKLPRRAGLTIDAAGHAFAVTLNGETLSMSSAKLPEVEEADSPRVLFEERIAMLRDLSRATDGLFAAFLKLRASSAWESQVGAIRKWIMEPPKKFAAA